MSNYKKVKTLSHEATESETFSYLSVNSSGIEGGNTSGIPVLYAGSQEGVINMWNIAPWKFLKSREIELDDNLLALVSYGDRVYIGVGDGSVEIWDKTAKKRIERLSEECEKMVTCMRVDENFLMVGSWDQTVTIWDHRKLSKSIHKFEAHSSPLTAIEQVGPFIVTSCREDGVKIWNTKENFKLVSEIQNKQGCKKMKTIGNKLYWLGDGDELRSWKISEKGEFGTVLNQIELKRGLATSLSVSENHVFVGSEDGFLDIFSSDLKLENTQKTKERIEELYCYDSLVFASIESGKILCYRAS